MKSSVATDESATQPNVDDRSISNMESASTRFLENVVNSNTAMMKESIELARETLTFSNTRLQATLDAWAALSRCRNLRDLSECQAELAKEATSQYTDAASRIITRWTNVVSSASVPGRDQSRSV
jgi:hypothetical protein